MFKKGVLLGLVIVMLIGAVAIARFPRPRRRSFGFHPAEANRVLSVDEIKTDTLINARDAPVAPAFAEGTWINSAPLTLDKLRGRVALVEFWTFGCYNCRNTLPSVKEWDVKYRDRGLTIVGVHTPETSEEYSIDNVRREVPTLGIKYPVVTDNDYKTWKSYNVDAWPTVFLIDKQGRIQWVHVGEGRYDETESVIMSLLAN